MTNKGNDKENDYQKNETAISGYSRKGVAVNQKKRTQNFPYSSWTSNPKDSKESVYGGKIQQREQDVRDILDNQIAGTPSYDEREKLKSSRGSVPKK